MTPVIERIDTQSPSPTDELIGRLRAAVPEYFTEGELDAERLLAMLGHMPDGKPERYSFTWAGKRDAIRALQTPSGGTLVPVPEESVNWETTQHLFIEGDNLEVLKLLYKAYFGKVKLIYIDPPYNTGNDFVYPDDFADPLGRYLEITGQKDAAGNLVTSNPETSGRYHSAWLSMMYPRLFLARQLLRDDGVIFISIDDTEVHNLRLIMNEIFGEENFVASIIWEKKYSPQNDARWLSENHDYVLLYARNKETWRPNALPRTEESSARYTNPDNDPRGPWKSGDFSVRSYTAANDYSITTPSGRVVKPPEGRCWVLSEARYREFLADNRIWFGANGSNVPAMKQFLSEVKQGMTSLTIWGRDEVGDTQAARRVIRDLFGDIGVFDTPKAVGLIRKMLALGTNPSSNDIVLDFFAGSATTAHAVLEQNQADGGNRQFIMVQLPEPIEVKGFDTIADVGKERIRRVLGRLQPKERNGSGPAPSQALGFKVFTLTTSTFKAWTGLPATDHKTYVDQMDLFARPLTHEWRASDVLAEIALRQGLSLNYTAQRQEVDSHTVYVVADSGGKDQFHVCLDDQVTVDLPTQLNLAKHDPFICRDAALDDTAAANLALQCRLITI